MVSNPVPALGVQDLPESPEAEVLMQQVYFGVSVSLLCQVNIVIVGECDQGCFVGP
jgi:hypothetical protein